MSSRTKWPKFCPLQSPVFHLLKVRSFPPTPTELYNCSLPRLVSGSYLFFDRQYQVFNDWKQCHSLWTAEDTETSFLRLLNLYMDDVCCEWIDNPPNLNSIWVTAIRVESPNCISIVTRFSAHLGLQLYRYHLHTVWFQNVHHHVFCPISNSDGHFSRVCMRLRDRLSMSLKPNGKLSVPIWSFTRKLILELWNKYQRIQPESH
jgi:hypothetical protein